MTCRRRLGMEFPTGSYCWLKKLWILDHLGFWAFRAGVLNLKESAASLVFIGASSKMCMASGVGLCHAPAWELDSVKLTSEFTGHLFAMWSGPSVRFGSEWLPQACVLKAWSPLCGTTGWWWTVRGHWGHALGTLTIPLFSLLPVHKMNSLLCFICKVSVIKHFL